MSESRSEFEAWLGREAYTVRSDSGKYESHHIDAMWSAWQASRRAALEEAAQVCESESLEEPQAGTEDIAYDMAVRHCADAIRAIARKEKE
jgi:hypothetical protein